MKKNKDLEYIIFNIIIAHKYTTKIFYPQDSRGPLSSVSVTLFKISPDFLIVTPNLIYIV